MPDPVKNQQRNEKEDMHSNSYGWNWGSYQHATNSRSHDLD
jgi:hypothetical protein